ncbi:MAG: ABC transporter ATP-binding protein [Alphaproteobacteria bacterium]|nr:ABC transporter ATP-binding protein [Alphaproteobacteria bacterium]
MNNVSLEKHAMTQQAGANVAAIRLEFRNVTRRFQGRGKAEAVTAIESVSLQVRDGEVVSLIGPSGCGKSTLLNLTAGLDRPSVGEVLVDGQPVTGPNAHVAFMLQKDLLLPWRTIRENVEFGLEIRKVPAAERKSTALAMLKACHLEGFPDHYPHQLSGGMRQRAALARTMATDPTVVLMDEPFSALDAQTKMILQKDLAQTLSSMRKTCLFITHDLAEAVALSDRVLVMSHRPGRIIEEIVIEIPGRDNPLIRRESPMMNGYLHRLGELLDLAHAKV